MKKLAEWIFPWCVLPLFLLIGCTDETNHIDTLETTEPLAMSRVIAKDYQVLAASREARQCRYQAKKDADAVLLLAVGQRVSLLSVEEKARRVNGHLWLHVYVEQEQECFVLADVLVPIASRPVIK